MIKFGLTTLMIGLMILPAVVLGESTESDSPEAIPTVVNTYRAAAAAIPPLSVEMLTMPEDDLAADRSRLEALIQDQETWSAFEDGEKAGLLVALADRTALDGDRVLARELYGILRSTEMEILQRWGTYMTAGIDFAEGSYASAAEGYGNVCESETPAEWRDHACSMAGLAQRLDELETAGGEHDGHATATP